MTKKLTMKVKMMRQLQTIEDKIDQGRSEVMRAGFPPRLLLIRKTDYAWMRAELIRLTETPPEASNPGGTIRCPPVAMVVEPLPEPVPERCGGDPMCANACGDCAHCQEKEGSWGYCGLRDRMTANLDTCGKWESRDGGTP